MAVELELAPDYVRLRNRLELLEQYGLADVIEDWATLSGAADTDRAAIILEDAGTHTDPVVGGTVSNSGVFVYDGGWTRVGSTAAVLAGEAAGIAAAAAVATALDPRVAAADAAAALALVRANAAAGYRDQTQVIYAAAALLTAIKGAFPTLGAATGAIAGFAADDIVLVIGDRPAFYQKTGGAWAFVNYLTQSGRDFYVDPATGNDANPGTDASPFATVKHAVGLSASGDTIWLAPGAIVKEDWQAEHNAGTKIPAGVSLRVRGGGRALFLGMDKIASAGWVNSSGAWASPVVHSTLGYNGVKGTGPGIHPGLQYRPPGVGEWRYLTLKSRSDFASDAAGIAYIQANEGFAYIQDVGGKGCSYSAGWEWTDLKYHVHLPAGVDPNTCEWMVRQRGSVPLFDKYHLIEGITFYGSSERGGLVARASTIRNVDLVAMGCHVCEMTGSEIDGLTIEGGCPGLEGFGYALHMFGFESDWLSQFRQHWRGVSVSNHLGAVFGCHGVGTVTPAPGPAGTVTFEVIVDGFRATNILTLFDCYNMLGNVTLNEPIVDGFYGFGSSDANITLNRPRYLHRPFIVNGVTQIALTDSLFGAYYGGRFDVNGGAGVSSHGQYIAYNFIPGSASVVTLNEHVLVVNGPNSYLWSAAVNTGGMILNRSAIQFFNYNNGPSGNDACYTNNVAGSPLTITESAVGGRLTVQNAAYTADIHSIIGGDLGLRATADVNNPVTIDPFSPWWTLGERFVSAAEGGVNQGAFVLTTRGVYTINSGFQYSFHPSARAVTLPTGFNVRGGFGGNSYDTKARVYGDAGKVYKADVFSGSPALVASGVTTNFIAHVKLSATVVLLLGDAGEIVQWDISTDTFTARASGVTFPLYGGLAIDANNAIVFGGDPAEPGTVGSGGAVVTTDGSATWAAAHASLANYWTYRCGTIVNGFLVLGAGRHAGLYTATVAGGVAGAWTQRNLIGEVSYTGFTSDPAGLKKIMYVGRAVSAQAARPRTGRTSHFGWIDASDASPANWKVHGTTKPLPYVADVAVNYIYDGGFVPEYLIFGQGREAAQSFQPDGSDWGYFTGGNIGSPLRHPAPAYADTAYLFA